MIIAIVAIFICILEISSINKKEKENYVNNPIIITDNQLNIKEVNKDISANYIIINSKHLVRIIDEIKKTNRLNKNTIGINTIPNDANLQLLVDPYINYYILKNKADISNYKEGIFVCVSNNVIRKEDCIWDLDGKVIAYIYMSDYLFIQALIKGYNLDINNIYLKKITERDFENTEKIFDYLFTYVVLNSEYMNFLFFQRYYINGFKDVDIHRIKAYYPFIKENYI